MKFLAIENEVPSADWNDAQPILRQEAEHGIGAIQNGGRATNNLYPFDIVG